MFVEFTNAVAPFFFIGTGILAVVCGVELLWTGGVERARCASCGKTL